MKKYSKWLILGVMVVILLGQGMAVAEELPDVNLVLHFETADGGILKGLIAHYLRNDYSMKIRDDAEYIVIILNLNKSIYQGLFTGSTNYMFISGVILERLTVIRSSGAIFERDRIIGGFANGSKWGMDTNKRALTKDAADAIAVIISGAFFGAGGNKDG